MDAYGRERQKTMLPPELGRPVSQYGVCGFWSIPEHEQENLNGNGGIAGGSVQRTLKNFWAIQS